MDQRVLGQSYILLIGLSPESEIKVASTSCQLPYIYGVFSQLLFAAIHYYKRCLGAKTPISLTVVYKPIKPYDVVNVTKPL